MVASVFYWVGYVSIVSFNRLGLALTFLLVVCMPASTNAFLTSPDARPPREIALEFLGQKQGLRNASEDSHDKLEVLSEYKTAHNGITHLAVMQKMNGIEVFNRVSTVNVAKNGQIVSAKQHHIAAKGAGKAGVNFKIDAVQAVEILVADRSLKLTEDLRVVENPFGDDQRQALSDGGIARQAIPVRLMYVNRNDHLRLAWRVEIDERARSHYWDGLVDATTGKVLLVHDRVIHEPVFAAAKNGHVLLGEAKAVGPAWLAAPDSYTVYPWPVESPLHGSRTNVVNPADPLASPFGWHDTNGVAGAESNFSMGNNADAYLDTDNTDSPTGGDAARADGGAALEFDYPIDLSQEPAAYQEASVVNLFYWNNVLHDVLYQYGFDEAAGNFQENNYGKGGVGGDSVQAEAQDGSGTGNANFFTPSDGSKPRMQMFIWDDTTPRRDSSLDNGIIAHEYGHGLSIRLTGGPNNVSCLDNTEQMGEGWSDYLTLMFALKPGDAGEDRRGVGNYVLGNTVDGEGIRDYPYSTDMVIDPRTYDDIQSASIPHGVGSVWCAMLWDMTWAMIDEYGFDPDIYNGTGGNNLALQLVVDGMKLQPCSPGFVDGRDAILAADLALSGGANHCLIWKAFAKRGLGFGASQGSSGSVSDGVEAFDLPPACVQDLKMLVTAAPSPVSAGDILTYTVNVTNDYTNALTAVTLSNAIPANTYYVPGSATDNATVESGVITWSGVNMATGTVFTRSFQVEVDPGFSSRQVFFDDHEMGTNHWVVSHGTGTADWTLSTNNPYSGLNAWFAEDVDAASDQYLDLVMPVMIEGSPSLFVRHQYNTEAGFDGGIMEISRNGGTWESLGPQMVQNGYNDTLSSGEDAFSGSSGGYVETVIDLSPFAGDSVRVRFRLSTDSSVGEDGWYVDDIRIVEPSVVRNEACVTAAEGNQSCDEVLTDVTEPLVSDFSIGLVESVLNVCQPVDGLLSVDVQSFNGYTNEVSLSATGFPVGASFTFVPPVVRAGTNSLLVISNTAAIPLGTYRITVSGSGDTGLRQKAFDMRVFPGDPLSFDLVSPSDGEIALPVAPALEWATSTGATEYVVQVDDDLGFTSLDYEQVVSGTNHVVGANLAYSSNYFWRVIAQNLCGSRTSGVRRFETEIPAQIAVAPSSIISTQLQNAVTFHAVTVSNLSVQQDLIWQLSEGGGVPASPGFAPSQDPVDQVELVLIPFVENQLYLDRDAAKQGAEKSLQFAEPHPVNFTPENAGEWRFLANGEMQWRLRIRSDGALNLNLGFGRYRMPDDGRMFLYTPDRRIVRGPFTARENETHGEFWSPIVQGKEVVIEITLPPVQRDLLDLTLSSINHGYRSIDALVSRLSGSCNVDVACGEDDGFSQIDAWRRPMQSVAAYSTGGSIFCTGALINNTAVDRRPLFLTAFHCGIDSDAAPSLVVYWNFENTTCRIPGTPEAGGAGDGPLSDFNTGSSVLAAYSPSDVTLLELDDPVSSTADPHWAGWDRSGSETPVSVGIHHPDGEEKRISFEDQPTTTTGYLSDGVPGDGSHVRVEDWDLGTTEPGSSGSPLFDQSQRIIGQLHGGYAACGNDDSDWYGRLNVSWDGGGTSDTRLSDWLDPSGTGAMVLNGSDTDVAWLSTVISNGVVIAMSNETILVRLDSTGLSPGDYQASLSLQSNDPLMPVVVVPVSLHVSGFDIQPIQAALEVCSPDSAVYGLNVNVENGFSGSVTLDITGEPAGSVVSIFPNPITLPVGTSAPHVQVSFLDTGAITSGTYRMTLSGVSGVSTNTADLTMTLFSSAPSTPIVLEPPANATEVGLTPTFVWQAVGGATAYNFELSDHPLFGNIIEARSLSETNLTLATALSGLQDYYWRITGSNTCGVGIFATNQFRTADIACGDFASTNVPVRIPLEGTSGSSTSLLQVALGGSITDVNVLNLNGTHTYIGDLVFILESPSGTQVTLLDEVCGGDENFDIGFDDDAESATPPCPPTDANVYQPASPLSAFNGESAAGTWRLIINDNAGSDEGSLAGWGLQICTAVTNTPRMAVSTTSIVHRAMAETVTIQNLVVSNLSVDTPLSVMIEEGGPAMFGGACSAMSNVTWLAVDPSNLVIPPSDAVVLDLLFDTNGSSTGSYSASLCLNTDDPAQPFLVLPVDLVIDPPLPRGPDPILYYDFEEVTGVVVTNRGTLGGIGTLFGDGGDERWISGPAGSSTPGGALALNGQNLPGGDGVHTGFTANELGFHQGSNYTAVAWVNFDGSAGDHHVFSQTNAADNILHLGIRNGRAHLGHWENDITGITTLQTGVWYHVAWRVENGIQSVYVDGVEDEGPLSRGALSNESAVVIGNSGRADWGFQGMVDEVMVFAEALSFGQINHLANGGSPFQLPDHPLDEGDYFTAPHGSGDGWNLYRVVGLDEGAGATWGDAENRASSLIDPSGLSTNVGHLVSLHSREEAFTIGRMTDFNTSWLGLTDNDTIFGGAEAGTNRNSGWVWTSGEPYVYQNWGVGEPDNSGTNGEDAVQLLADGKWSDTQNGLSPQTNNASILPYVIEWNIGNTSPIPGARIPQSVLPDSMPGRAPGEQTFGVTAVKTTVNSQNIALAVERLVNGQGVVSTSETSVINFVDPEGASAGLFGFDVPYLGNTTNLDTQLIHSYRGLLAVPSNAVYTIGLNSDDASALRVKGQSWSSISGSGMLDTFSTDTVLMERGTHNFLGTMNLEAGLYELDLVVYQDSGSSGHELFAAEGAYSDVRDTHTWRLIGYQPSVDPLPVPSIDPMDQWVVETSTPGGNAVITNLNNLADVTTEFASDAGTITSNWARIDFVDPESSAGRGLYGNDHPFDNGTGGDDDNFAVRAVGQLMIPASGVYVFGFAGDEGGSLEISGQSFSNLSFGVNGNSVINGGRLEHDANTENSETRGMIALAEGQYTIIAQYWERGGGAHFEVHGDNAVNVIPRLLEAPSSIGGFELDIPGMQLAGAATPMVLTLPTFNPVADNFTLVWLSEPGRSYQIQWSEDGARTWNDLQGAFPAEGNQTSVTITDNFESEFILFRVVVP